MRKKFDKKSGAIIYQHTPDELKQAEINREAAKNKKMLDALCKMLNISKEQLEETMKEME